MSERGPRCPERGLRVHNEAEDPTRTVEGIASGMPQGEVERRMTHPETREGLLNIDPVIWLRGAIALDSGRHPVEVTNQELANRYHLGGRFEWDPYVVKQVKKYLRGMGFYVTLLLK